MALTITYKKKRYPKENSITLLTNLIKKNINLLKIISSLYILKDDYKKYSQDSYKLRVQKAIKRGVISGYINRDVGNKFYELWIEISNEGIGEVLEQLISNIGPYKIGNFSRFNSSMQVKIDEIERKNDYDVVFFEDEYIGDSKEGNKILIDGFIEFHECKKNVCTFIPCDFSKDISSNRNYKQVYNKLEFMYDTYTKHTNGEFYIPTFFPMVDSQREFLNKYDNGKYSFINILDIDQIRKVFVDEK